MSASNGKGRLFYIATAVFLVLVGSYLVRRIFLPNPETVENTPATTIEEYVPPEFVPPQYVPAVDDLATTGTTSQYISTTSANAPTSMASPTSLTDIPRPGSSDQEAADGSQHVVVTSKMTPDGKWFPIDFGDYGSYNPNLIPHPDDDDTWYMIAQGLQPELGVSGPRPVYSIELVCEAEYVNRTMKCKRSPISVPIASTASDHCVDTLSAFNYFIGPNDPRVFFGPDRPYITYGSASQYTCLGQWIHDLRRLVRWNTIDALDKTQRFFWPTELQRPAPYGTIEKNWFAFWDASGEMYLHYDILPHRAFARVSADGASITPDLAPQAAAHDEGCMAQYMPRLLEHEHVHQATNSLAIILCHRSDHSCDAAQQTYIFTVFHHKTVYGGHNLYEPYLLIFENTAPFHVHAISSKPFWINGRGKPGESWADEEPTPQSTSQMMYITSINWKERGLNYTGYLDDDLMIAFGIEDKHAGGIDVTAEQLFKELHLCG